MTAPNTEPIPATDEDVHGIRQSILKGFRPIPLSYFKNGGYLGPGQTAKDAISTVSIESLLARIEQEREMRRELQGHVDALLGPFRVREHLRDGCFRCKAEATLARAAKMEEDNAK